MDSYQDTGNKTNNSKFCFSFEAEALQSQL